MKKNYSKTKLIKENRITRISLESFIESMKQGYFDSCFDPLTKSTNEYSHDCKKKSCTGKLNYDTINHVFYCNVCFLKQNLVFLREVKTIQFLKDIDETIESLRNYKIKELENIHQLLRNLYRITVDELSEQEPTEDQIIQAKKLFNDVSSTLNGLKFSVRQVKVYSLIKNGKLMQLDELDEHIIEVSRKSRYVLEKIERQLSYKNILRLIVCNIKNEEKRIIHNLEEKHIEILRVIY